jgi:hypothetical protein
MKYITLILASALIAITAGCKTQSEIEAKSEANKTLTVVRTAAYTREAVMGSTCYVIPPASIADVAKRKRHDAAKVMLSELGLSVLPRPLGADYIIVVKTNQVLDASNQVARGSLVLRAMDGEQLRDYTKTHQLDRSLTALWEASASYQSKLQLPLPAMFPFLLDLTEGLVGTNHASQDSIYTKAELEAALGVTIE